MGHRDRHFPDDLYKHGIGFDCQNETLKAENRTEKQWNTNPETFRLRGSCQWIDKLSFLSSRFMPRGSVVTSLRQKRAVFPAFLSREVILGQMRNIDIHFIIYCKKEGVLLQPLRWRCVDCVIHHEPDLREQQQYIYVARTSNNRVIAACDLYRY